MEFDLSLAHSPCPGLGTFVVIPATITLLVLIVLVFWVKSASVEVHLLTYSVSFQLSPVEANDQSVELVRSLRVRRVMILTQDPVFISAIDLHDARTDAAIQAGTLQVRPRTNGWIEFKAHGGHIVLGEMQVQTGSRVDLSTGDGQLQIEIHPLERTQGKVSLNGSSLVTTMDCDITDENGKTIAGTQEQQQSRFRLTPSSRPVLLNSSKPLDLRVMLAENDQEFAGSFGDSLRVSHVAFPPGDRSTAIPIRSGSISFRKMNKASLTLQSGFLKFAPDDILDILAIGMESGALDLRGSGTVRSLTTGSAPGTEELPSVLEWLYRDQRLGMIIVIVLWIIGAAAGVMRFVGSKGKS